MSDRGGAGDKHREVEQAKAGRDDLTRAGSDARDKQWWTARLSPFGAWSAGIVSAVVATVVTGWLVAWGLLPDEQSASGPLPPVSTAQSPPQQPAPERLPFTVAVSDRFVDGGQPRWISPLPPSDAPPRPNGDAPFAEWTTWVKRAKAVLTDTRPVFFTVQGTSEAQVTLLDLRVNVVARRPAMRGTIYGLSGGDPHHFRIVSADLDKNPPRMSDHYDDFFAKAYGKKFERRPIRFPYRVSLTDAETFVVHAYTKLCDCEFVIELSWASQGRTGTQVVNDHGKPFRVTGTSNSTRACTIFFTEPERCEPVT